MIKLVTCTILLALIAQIYSLDNGLALTPPMGWMSWQRFRCITDCDKYPKECISEDLFKRTADLMVSEGYLDAGYEYVVIDDCWLEHERDHETQKLVPDRKRFPNGMKAVADYIHSKGLKFGLYQDYGTKTCAGYPGVIGHMELDAQTFADWDVDYVKLDGCYADIDDMDFGYPEFGRFLNKTGRPMVYSCSWPYYQEIKGKIPNYEALKKHCNLWRNWHDIQDSFESVKTITKYFAEKADQIQPHAGPGHWNDPDMLLHGNYGLSRTQSETQMAVWAILAAPLLMSADLSEMEPRIKEILLNKEVIAVNQDPLGIQGWRIKLDQNIETWVRPITPVKDGQYSFAIAFVSHRIDGAPHEISAPLALLGLKNKNGYSVTDLFNKNTKASEYRSDSLINVRVPPNGVKFYKFSAMI